MDDRDVRSVMSSHGSNLGSNRAKGLLAQFIANNEGFKMEGSHNGATDFFQEAREKMLGANTNGSYFERVLHKRDEQVSNVVHSSASSHTSMGMQEFVRSSSAGSGWSKLPAFTPTVNPELQSTMCNPRYDFPRFASFGGFPRFAPGFDVQPGSGNREESHNVTSWTHKSGTTEITSSTFEYRVQMANSFSSTGHNMQIQELYADSESDSDDEDGGCLSIANSEYDDTSSIGTLEIEPRKEMLAIEAPAIYEPRKEKTFRIANELYTTEEKYVKVLHLIDQIFHFRVDHENRAHSMFPQEMIPQMFSNIKSIYKLHSEFLLPQLKARIDNWEQDPRIGDIMKNFAPFLKMYTEYVKNFDNAMNIINALGTKNRRFSELMSDIQKMEECCGLTVSHHMLSPIQRIPRYELLLKDYFKKLAEDSPDRADTEKALHLVSTAANHANDMMKKIDKFKHLLELQENIIGVIDLVSPTRELLKEGKIIKISARSGDHQERYLFLFSDYLFLCSPRLNRVIAGPTYRLRAKFSLESMRWYEGDNLETTNTFYIRDHTKNVELYTQTTEEKSAWRDTFLQAIQEFYTRKSSLRIGKDVETDLGKKRPNLIKTDGVTRCMECRSNFGVMKRKHHCRACGLVFCVKCSSQKYPLTYEDNKPGRVCKNCFETLTRQSATPAPDASPTSESEDSASAFIDLDKGVLDVPADSPSVISGYLQLKTQGKAWVRRWFSLHSDFVLYSFLTESEQRAMTATPVPGFTVTKITTLKGEPLNDKEKSFKMYHAKKTYYFQATSKDEVDRWVHALQMSAQAELPTSERASE